MKKVHSSLLTFIRNPNKIQTQFDSYLHLHAAKVSVNSFELYAYRVDKVNMLAKTHTLKINEKKEFQIAR